MCSQVRELARSGTMSLVPVPTQMVGAWSRLRDALPQGDTLPDDTWLRRHRALLGLLWAHVLIIPLYALAQGYDPTHALLEGAIILPFAIAGVVARDNRKLAVTVAALGLITASALVVHVSNGLIEAHFHFFVAIVLLTLYEDWIPFLVAFGYVLVHHGLLGVIAPEAVYSHAAAYAHPWRWAAIHAGFIGAAGAAAIVNWRLNEQTRQLQVQHERDYGVRLESLNEELRTADQLKSSFLAMASHELRTPLTAIGGFSSTMLHRWDAMADEDKIQYLGIIDGQAARLTRLVDDLLVLSRIESGRFEVQSAPIRILEVMEQTARDLGLSEQVYLECEPDVEALAGRDHVAQMLVNFVSNAVKYGEGPIRMEAERRDGRIELAVRDCGEGVPKEFVSRLFERFAQGPRVEAMSGTGLGLSIVRGLAEAYGGEAWYEPNTPHGSCFRLSLPAA